MTNLKGVLYGPQRSRRWGRFLGINILPVGAAICGMDCVYCPYRRRGAPQLHGQSHDWPAPEQVETALSDRLRQAAERNELIDRLALAGHGEPTLHPDFSEILMRVRAVKAAFIPQAPLAIMSNSTTAAWPFVRAALARADERYMKLDAGDPITRAHVNRAWSSSQSIVDALRALSPVVIWTTFVSDAQGVVDNTTEGAIREWLEAIQAIQPARVQIGTSRPALTDVHAVPTRRLREIAQRVRAEGIPADVFPGVGDRLVIVRGPDPDA